MHIKGLRFFIATAGLIVAAACGGAPPTDSPPAVPTGLAAQAGDQRVQLRWNANTESDLDIYRLFWGSESGSLTESRTIAAPGTSAVVAELDNDTAYFFALAAVDAADKSSARTAEVSATPRGAAGNAPAVTATQPADGGTDVPLNASIRVTFSRAMDKPAAEAAFGLEPSAACAFSWNFKATTMTCAPASPLSPDTAYSATIGVTARDVQGAPLAAPHTFGFTTGTSSLQVCTFGGSSLGSCVFAP